MVTGDDGLTTRRAVGYISSPREAELPFEFRRGISMSAGQDDGSQLISITAGALLPAIGAAAVGLMAAYGMPWPSSDPGVVGWGAAFGRMFAGLCVGGVTGLAVAWFMAWHASSVAALDDRPELAPLWGAVPGVLFGLSLGPLFAGVVGWYFGYLVSAIWFGLFFGPIAGVVGWEVAYFVTLTQHPRRRRH
jgi:MFS family permease